MSRLSRIARPGTSLLALAALTAFARPAQAGCVTQVSAGKWHTCSIGNDGRLWCWGDNLDGKLGDGTTVSRLHPVPVTALGSDVAQVAAGDSHTCARKTDGTLWCWGYNGFGELGDGTTTSRSLPVQVTALGNAVAAVSAGDLHTCARKTDGSLWCWGANTDGELGDGTFDDRATPVPVTALGDTVAEVALGSAHTCARKTDGSLWCWGWNDFGQLGDGTSDSSSTPVPVTGLQAGVASVSLGEEHSCVARTDGSVWCWGWNDFGQLGDGTATGRPAPVAVGGLAGVRAVRLGAWHSCALKIDNSLWCWGYNGQGQLGNGTAANAPTPVAVSALGDRVAEASTYAWHVCAVEAGGTPWCWGDNELGQLGDGTTTARSLPGQVPAVCAASVPATGRGARVAMAVALAALAVFLGRLGPGQPARAVAPQPVDRPIGGVTRRSI